MTIAPIDRRRTPRVTLPRGNGQPSVVLPVSTTVQVLDLSQSGALLAVSDPLVIGQRAQLRTRIGAEPLTVQVECQRVTAGHDESARVGARFADIDDESQRKIDAFLNGES